jgi:hypothetical protein
MYTCRQERLIIQSTNQGNVALQEYLTVHPNLHGKRVLLHIGWAHRYHVWEAYPEFYNRGWHISIRLYQSRDEIML